MQQIYCYICASLLTLTLTPTILLKDVKQWEIIYADYVEQKLFYKNVNA